MKKFIKVFRDKERKSISYVNLDNVTLIEQSSNDEDFLTLRCLGPISSIAVLKDAFMKEIETV